MQVERLVQFSYICDCEKGCWSSRASEFLAHIETKPGEAISSLQYLFFPFLHDLFHPSYLPIRQTDLDPMRMIRRFRQDIFDNTPGQFASALILFQDNQHGHTWLDVCAGLSIHSLN